MHMIGEHRGGERLRLLDDEEIDRCYIHRTSLKTQRHLPLLSLPNTSSSLRMVIRGQNLTGTRQLERLLDAK
jgi:hypothetical protein